MKNNALFTPPVEQAYAKQHQNLTEMRTTKDKLSYESHEMVISRLIQTLGQAALSEALNHLSTKHYGGMPEHKKSALKTLLVRNIDIILKKRPDLKLVHLADGAQDNWTLAKNKGYPIGSGVVEASCKTLVGQRLKRAGMSWQHNGGSRDINFSLVNKKRSFR